MTIAPLPCFYHIIPPYGAISLHRAHSFDCATFIEKLKRDLIASGVSVAIGGLDFSVNVPRDDRIAPFLQAHVHVAIAGQKLSWKKHFAPSEAIPRPVYKSRYPPRNAAFAYATRNKFDRKKWIWKFYKNGRRTPSWNTRGKTLLGHEFVVLMLFLDRIGLDARLFLVGVKRTTGDTVRLVSIARRPRQSSAPANQAS